MKVISLFSGAGGMDIGFEEAGFKVVVAVEIDSACCQTLRANRPKLNVVEKDITDVSGQELLDITDMKITEPSLVIGGPPCQSFSLAGKRLGMEDDRGKLVYEFTRIVRETLPVGFVMENVKGMLNWSKGKAIEAIKNEFETPIVHNGKSYQYDVNFKVLNGADFGLAQQRERLFIVGNRVGIDFQFPSKTHGIGNGLKPFRTVWDEIGDLPKANEPSKTALRVSKTIKGRIEKHGY
jgi:DNA (cytosine-5)-methyltransferase 1